MCGEGEADEGRKEMRRETGGNEGTKEKFRVMTSIP